MDKLWLQYLLKIAYLVILIFISLISMIPTQVNGNTEFVDIINFEEDLLKHSSVQDESRTEEEETPEEEEETPEEEEETPEEEEETPEEEEETPEEEEETPEEEEETPAEEEEAPAEEEETPGVGEEFLSSTEPRFQSLGDWTAYNGLIFNNASIYQSSSGGGFAVSQSLNIYENHTIGENYTSNYDPTAHIGEYKNENDYPALMVGGNSLTIDPNAEDLNVFGGAIVMNEELMEINQSLDNGFKPQEGSVYETVDKNILSEWFNTQYELVLEASEIYTKANDVSITLTELSSGDYIAYGPEYFENKHLSYHDKVYNNALFINVHTDSEVNFGQWWPVHSVIDLDVNWAIDYELVVFSFPDAVNVTMNSSAFSIRNMSHWSTTSDAWIGEQGMVERLALAEKVVYNFPNAGSFEANQALIQGSVLAPKASFTGIGVGDSGHIYGHIVARNYVARGNFTIHPFELSHWAFDIAEDTINNNIKTGSVLLRQYLYLNGQPTNIRLEGGEFYLINTQGKYFMGDKTFTEDIEQALLFQTNSSENTVISQVPLGAYILQSMKPPQGFLLNESDSSNAYTYANYPVSLSRADDHVSVLRYTEPILIDVSFQMIDRITESGLPDAVFIIVRDADELEDTTYGATYAGDENGFFTCSNMPVGSYHLMEIHPPPGYNLLPEARFDFKVIWDDELGGNAVILEDGTVIDPSAGEIVKIRNDQNPDHEENTATLIKYAADEHNNDTPYTLQGAKFLLYRKELDTALWQEVTQNKNGDLLEITTNEWGYCLLHDLVDGVYRLVEVTAPLGYHINNRFTDEDFPGGYAHEFVFTNEISHQLAYIPNTALEAEIILRAQYRSVNEITPLQGVSYKLDHLIENGLTWEELYYSKTTDISGEIFFTGLKKGYYRLTQLLTPIGFDELTPNLIYFELSYDDENKPVLAAVYNDEMVTLDSYPVAIDPDENVLKVEYQVQTRDLSLYVIDNDYTTSIDEGGETVYHATYLEEAEFRLQRRTNARSAWVDYGGSFTSHFLYDDEGDPVLDQYGNHMAAAVFDGGLSIGDYLVVETNPPQGFHTNSSIKVTLNDGVTGYQVHLFTINQAMVGTGQESQFIIENYKEPVNLTFRLKDAEKPDQGLEGGIFSLYSCDQDHVHDLDLNSSSCFLSSEPISGVSDSQGLISFEDLKYASYLLVEDKAPETYELSKSQWLITVYEKNKTIEVVEISGSSQSPVLEEDGYYPVYNRKQFILPMTGGPGAVCFYAAGTLCIGISLMALKIKIKER